MIDVFIRSALGPLGSRILDAYLQYSFWINGAILIYAVAVFWGRRAYGAVLDKITAEVLASKPELTKYKFDVIRKILNGMEIPYTEAGASTPSPFLCRADGWRIYTKTEKNIRKLLSPEALAGKIGERGHH